LWSLLKYQWGENAIITYKKVKSLSRQKRERLFCFYDLSPRPSPKERGCKEVNLKIVTYIKLLNFTRLNYDKRIEEKY
jgi:hypothetical protein